MSNVLPVIEMPAPAPEPALPKVPSAPPMLENPDGDKDLIDKIEESLDSKSDDEEDIINIEPRDIPDEEDVFTNPPPTVKPIVNDEPPPNEFEPKGKRKYVRKAPMSEKQKAHLERIRKIAQEKKAMKKKEREEQQAQDKLLLQQKKQEEQEKKEEEKRIKEEKKIQEEVNKRLYKPEPEQKQGGTPQNFFTKEDMENAMLSAITSYDAVRKKQKQEKKVRIAKEAQEAQMRRTLENAIRPPQVQSDPWRSYFT
jgi:hypothetical protein